MSLFPFIFERRFKMTKAEFKKFVKEHKTEIIVGGAALVLGVKIGKNAATREHTKDIQNWFAKNDYLSAMRCAPKAFTRDLGKMMKSANGGVILTAPNKVTVKQALTDISTEEGYKWLNADCHGVVIFS